MRGLEPGGVALGHCDDWALGPGASLRRGLDAVPREADRVIVVLADGRIAERGTHDALFAAGGLYRRFYDMQFRV